MRGEFLLALLSEYLRGLALAPVLSFAAYGIKGAGHARGVRIDLYVGIVERIAPL